MQHYRLMGQKCQWHGSDWKLIVCFDSQQKCNQISRKAVTTIFTYVGRLQNTCIKLQRKKTIHVCVSSFFDRFWSETSVNYCFWNWIHWIVWIIHFWRFSRQFLNEIPKSSIPIHLFKYSVLTNLNYAKRKPRSFFTVQGVHEELCWNAANISAAWGSIFRRPGPHWSFKPSHTYLSRKRA